MAKQSKQNDYVVYVKIKAVLEWKISATSPQEALEKAKEVGFNEVIADGVDVCDGSTEVVGVISGLNWGVS